MKSKCFIANLSGFVVLTALLQAISKGLIFSDSHAGEQKTFLPKNKDIKHTDPDGKTYSFPLVPSSQSASSKKNKTYVVVFGVKVSWEHAKLGAQILANLTNSKVLLIHNGSCNKLIDYTRAVLNRMHFWLFGLGHEKAINKTENVILQSLIDNPNEDIEIIGHSAGASTTYSAIRKLIREHPELASRIKQDLSVQFWGSPEYLNDMVGLSEYCKASKVFNRSYDYIAEAFEEALYGGVFLPVAITRLLLTLKNHGNQHRAILYLEDFMKQTLAQQCSGLTVQCQRN